MLQTLGVLMAVAAMVAGAGAPAMAAGEASAQGAAPAAGEAGLPVTVAGVQVFVDPETGRLRPPTEEEAGRLAAGLQEIFAPRGFDSRPDHREDGTVSMVLDPSYLSLSLARADAEGGVVTRCVESPQEAADFLAASAAADRTAGPEEK